MNFTRTNYCVSVLDFILDVRERVQSAAIGAQFVLNSTTTHRIRAVGFVVGGRRLRLARWRTSEHESHHIFCTAQITRTAPSFVAIAKPHLALLFIIHSGE